MTEPTRGKALTIAERRGYATQRSVDGASNREIGREMGVAESTVRNDLKPSGAQNNAPGGYTPSGPAPNAPVPTKPPPKGPSWTGRTAQRVASDVLGNLAAFVSPEVD